MNALGVIEVFGLTTALVAADAACKAGNVIIEAFDNNKPANAESLKVPLLIIIKFRGGVSDVKVAMEKAIEAANTIAGVSCSTIISRVDEGIESFAKKSCIK